MRSPGIPFLVYKPVENRACARRGRLATMGRTIGRRLTGECKRRGGENPRR